MGSEALIRGKLSSLAAAQAGVAASPARAGPQVLIETKLYAPRERREWVERAELIRHLAGATANLVLVAAPAGFGKTTLVAQWRSSPAEQRPFAWVSLDRGDDDPARLWWHVVCALQRACGDFDGEEILRALRVQVPDFAAAVLPMLVNGLAALAQPVVLVLDDYQMIKERSCHDQVAALLDHQPPSAQLVLITRTVPELPLARLRAAGEMMEIHAGDLRFEAADIAALVRTVSGVELGESDLAGLLERTEGWAAAVYLAALSLRGQSSPSRFVGQFSGENRFVADFLAEEVLTRQPTEVRQFLAQTSILGRFCAPLCDAVLGWDCSAQVMDVLERENLFVVPLDEKRGWFRYHHLFAHVLRRQLTRTAPDIVPALHERASAWHQAAGTPDEAIHHALAADDAAGAARLIARHWYGYVDSGRVATVRGWLCSLGEDQISAHPLAAHSAMWVAGLTGDQASVQRWMPLVAAASGGGERLPDGMRSFEFSAALLHASFGFDGLRVMREAGATATGMETDPTSPWYGPARIMFGFALYLSGDIERAAAQMEDALQNNSAIAMTRMLALAGMAWLAADAGRLAQAEELADMARVIATDPSLGLDRTPQSTIAYIGTGAVYAARGQLPEARGDFERALRSRSRWPGISPWPTAELMLRLAAVLTDMNETAEAAALLSGVRQLIQPLPDGTDALLARIDRLDRRAAGGSRTALPDEPLTKREERVLRLLEGPLSLRGIAGQLFVSPNTVKTHTLHIYRKLGVSDRQDAVAKGRSLGLL